MGEDERDDLVEDDEPVGEEEPKGTSKIVKILLAVAGGILLVVLITGISYLVSKYVTERNYERTQDIVAAPAPPPLNTYELPSFSKTTADPEPHFIRLQISLGYENNLELNNELVRRRDEILHVVNILLQGKKYDELNSVTGVVELGEEIKAHVNVRLTSGKIQTVYFKEFVVN